VNELDGECDGEGEMVSMGVDPENKGEVRLSGEPGVWAGVGGREECFIAERRGGPGIGIYCGWSRSGGEAMIGFRLDRE